MAGLSNCRLCKETNNSVLPQQLTTLQWHVQLHTQGGTGWQNKCHGMHDARQVYGHQETLCMQACAHAIYLQHTYIRMYSTLDIQ